MNYGVWRTAEDYFSGAGPQMMMTMMEDGCSEPLVRRAVEEIPPKGRSHRIVAHQDDTAPQGWVNDGAITCGCTQLCHGKVGTVEPLRRDPEIRDHIRLQRMRAVGGFS